MRLYVSIVFFSLVETTVARCDEPLFQNKTFAVPRVQAVPMPDSRTTFQLDGRDLTTCHFDSRNRRIFWYPVQSSHGPSLTRMGHPHDPLGHSHHNSFWLAHADVNGVNFWGDHGKTKGQIKNVLIPREAYSESDDSASMLMLNHWIGDDDSKVFLIETRRTEIVPLDGFKSWMMIVDVSFSIPPKSEKTTFNPTPFGLIAVRMAKQIGVNDGGGRILNSEGAINEREVFRKPARWCDYSGRITNDSDGFAGITLMNHSTNPQNPTPFHVRDDGWMGACLNLDSKIEVGPQSPLRLRYCLWIHDGIPSQEHCEAIWKKFIDLPMADMTIKN